MSASTLAPIAVRVRVKKLFSVLPNGAFIAGGEDENCDSIRVLVGPHSEACTPVAGETWEFSGHFRIHPQYGSQFHASCGARPLFPQANLLHHYLAEHPDFVGIGPASARKLCEHFGERIYTVLDQGDVPTLCSVLSPKVAHQLVHMWREKREEASTIEFLDGRGVDWRLATKLHKVWGANVQAVLAENPYRLLAVADWKAVDGLAQRFGVAHDDPRRLVGAVEACLYARLSGGHTLTGIEILERSLRRLIDRRSIGKAIQAALVVGAAKQPMEGAIQPAGAWALEFGLARRLRSLLDALELPPDAPVEQLSMMEDAIRSAEVEQGFSFSAEQKAGILSPFQHRISLLLGGAGVGKSSVLRGVVGVAHCLEQGVIQLAVAGRAARRLELASGHEAMTLAKFIWSARSGRVVVPTGSLVIVDEASMLDLSSAFRLLQLLPDTTRILLVGDALQLPPVGFGLVLHCLNESRVIPTSELKAVHRQSGQSGIPPAAESVRHHRMPDFVRYEGKHDGVSFLDCCGDDLMPLLYDIQHQWEGEEYAILAPLRNGPFGVKLINAACHAMKNGGDMAGGFFVGEPIMHVINDYERMLMNGALGRVLSVEQDGALTTEFEGQIHKFAARDVPGRIELAYAMTVHKAQGSQFSRVIVVIGSTKALDHAIVYTAMTRGIRQVVFVGDQKMLKRAIEAPARGMQRQVALTQFLTEALPITPDE